MNRVSAITRSLTLLLATTGWVAPPKGLDLSMTRTSAEGKHVMSLQPPARPAAINPLRSWQVKLSTPAGAPAALASIQVM